MVVEDLIQHSCVGKALTRAVFWGLIISAMI